MLLFSFCSCHWLLPWLLSGLLGALLGWLLGRGRRETVVEEKIVYKDKIVYQDKIVYKDTPAATATVGAAAAAKVEDPDKEDDYLSCKEYEGRDVNDKKNNVALFKHSNGQYYFALYNANGAVKLRSEGFRTAQERDQELSGVLRFHDNRSMYKTLTRGKYTMDVLYDDTGREVGRSCLKKKAEKGKAKKAPAKPKAKKSTAKVAAAAPKQAAKKDIYAALKNDNLQVVEGIGPKMDEVLKKHGITTWAALEAKSSTEVRAILDKENPTRYRIIDPVTWPEQARLANAGEWDDLITYQKRLDTGRVDVGDGATNAKVEKLLIKMGVLKKWKKDDLKAIEGIGPKIEGLLQTAGIKTWKTLSETSVDKIQGILDQAGSRYKLADPGSWPKQAEMAAAGKWDDLKEYQDFLVGGK